MSNAFTPGPWTYDVNDGGDDFRLTGSDGETIVGGCGCCGSPWMGGPWKANANLITAVPELFEALEQIERLSREADGTLVDVRAMLGDIARAAIAKATNK